MRSQTRISGNQPQESKATIIKEFLFSFQIPKNPAFYSSVYVFITKVLIEETIFTSSTGDRGPPVLNAVI